MFQWKKGIKQSITIYRHNGWSNKKYQRTYKKIPAYLKEIEKF